MNIVVLHPLIYIDFQVELLLDKLKQKGAIRRALFLHNRSPGHSKNMTIFRGGQMQCEELIAYLRVRDIFVSYYFYFFIEILFTSYQLVLNLGGRTEKILRNLAISSVKPGSRHNIS